VRNSGKQHCVAATPRTAVDSRSHPQRTHHRLARRCLRETRPPAGERFHRSRRYACPPTGRCTAPHPLLPMSTKPAAHVRVSTQLPLDHETAIDLLTGCAFEGPCSRISCRSPQRLHSMGTSRTSRKLESIRLQWLHAGPWLRWPRIGLRGEQEVVKFLCAGILESPPSAAICASEATSSRHGLENGNSWRKSGDCGTAFPSFDILMSQGVPIERRETLSGSNGHFSYHADHAP